MSSMVPINPEVKKPAHSPEARAKAGASIRAKKEAQRAAAAKAEADRLAEAMQKAQRMAQRAVYSGVRWTEDRKTRDEQINEWAEEFMRRWYGTEEERRAQRKADREFLRELEREEQAAKAWKKAALKEEAAVWTRTMMFFSKWRKLAKFDGVKAALRHGMEMAEKGEPFPTEMQAHGKHDLLFAALRKGFEEARDRL